MSDSIKVVFARCGVSISTFGKAINNNSDAGGRCAS